MDNPCRWCLPPKRTPTCHSTCEEYKLWREEYDRRKADVDNEKGRCRDYYIEKKKRYTEWLREHKR
jgi:hypothetical protein